MFGGARWNNAYTQYIYWHINNLLECCCHSNVPRTWWELTIWSATEEANCCFINTSIYIWESSSSPFTTTPVLVGDTKDVDCDTDDDDDDDGDDDGDDCDGGEVNDAVSLKLREPRSFLLSPLSLSVATPDASAIPPLYLAILYLG